MPTTPEILTPLNEALAAFRSDPSADGRALFTAIAAVKTVITSGVPAQDIRYTTLEKEVSRLFRGLITEETQLSQEASIDDLKNFIVKLERLEGLSEDQVALRKELIDALKEVVKLKETQREQEQTLARILPKIDRKPFLTALAALRANPASPSVRKNFINKLAKLRAKVDELLVTDDYEQKKATALRKFQEKNPGTVPTEEQVAAIEAEARSDAVADPDIKRKCFIEFLFPELLTGYESDQLQQLLINLEASLGSKPTTTSTETTNYAFTTALLSDYLALQLGDRDGEILDSISQNARQLALKEEKEKLRRRAVFQSIGGVVLLVIALALIGAAAAILAPQLAALLGATAIVAAATAVVAPLALAIPTLVIGAIAVGIAAIAFRAADKRVSIGDILASFSRALASLFRRNAAASAKTAPAQKAASVPVLLDGGPGVAAVAKVAGPERTASEAEPAVVGLSPAAPAPASLLATPPAKAAGREARGSEPAPVGAGPTELDRGFSGRVDGMGGRHMRDPLEGPAAKSSPARHGAARPPVGSVGDLRFYTQGDGEEGEAPRVGNK